MYGMRGVFIASVMLTALAAYGASQWRTAPQESTLKFVATQAGAKFEGAFDKFTADIRFDPQDLAASRFSVSIDVRSVNSRDAERDEIIRGPDLFAAQQWPTAQYVAERFTAKGGNRYRAAGKLTLRNVTRDTPIEFTFEPNGERAWLKGAAKLNRLDFGVGQGEWKSTEWVGAEVEVKFSLLLTP